MQNFNEQYQHPEWIKKRDEILKRDFFQCRCCKLSFMTMQVHHLYYERGHKL